MGELIHTKLMVEVRPGKILSLGFGDIALSRADLVCVSSFRDSEFVPNSSIGAIDRALGNGVLAHALDHATTPDEPCTLLDVSNASSNFKNILVIWMGTFDQFLERGSTDDFIQIGLHAALSKIRKLEAPAQIDIAALGSHYGGLHRQRIFDHLVAWASDLFEQCPSVSHLRLVAYDLDTFVDFFEALHRMKGWAAKQMSFGSQSDFRNCGMFEREVTSAAQLLEQNPKQVLVICRTIVEQVINCLCKEKSGQLPVNLFVGTKELYDRKVLPPHINSFLHTCRVVGNFAVHPDAWDGEFDPTRRDAEAVMLLTLRVVEWFLANSGKTTK